MNDLKDHPKHAETLGFVVSACATIEKVCCEIAAGLLGVDDAKAEAIFYSLQANRARFEILTALTSKFAPNRVRQPLLDELAAVQRLFNKRNDLIHNLWITRHGKPHLHNIKRALGQRERIVSDKEMTALLSDLEDSQSRLVSISLALRP